MKKILLVLSVSILFLSCREEIIVYPSESFDNFVFINSEPTGASIFQGGLNTELNTPAWLRDLDPGYHSLTLVLDGYTDTTFFVNVKDSTKKYITVLLKQK